MLLLVSPRSEDHRSLQAIFRGSPWELQVALTANDGLKRIRRRHGEIPVVICENSLPDGDWKLLLGALDDVPSRPSLIVFSRAGDERLWAEVLNLGAFDLLLGDPFVPEEVLRVTQSAWRAWNRAAEPSAAHRIGPRPAVNLAPIRLKSFAAGNPV